MELKSNKYFDTIYSAKLSSFILGESDLYNEIISKYSDENPKHLEYINKFITSYSNMSNSALELKSSLQNIFKLFNTIETISNRALLDLLENELKIYHIRLKSFFDTLIISIVIGFGIVLPYRGNKLLYLLKHDTTVTAKIITQLKNINEAIKNYDNGKRNKIIHEGSYQDDSIDGMRILFITGKGMFGNKDDYKIHLIKKKQELIIKKYEQIDDLNLNIFQVIVEIHESLIEFYYAKREELSHYIK